MIELKNKLPFWFAGPEALKLSASAQAFWARWEAWLGEVAPQADIRVCSTGALALQDVPKRMLIIGGGIIGLEMATVYDALGSKISVVELMDQLMPGADKDMVNPGSLILSGEMMFKYLGWDEAAQLIVKGLEGASSAKTVTYDFHRLMEGAVKLSTSEFGEAIVQHMDD